MAYTKELLIYDNKRKWGFWVYLKAIRGQDTLSGVTCVLSAYLVDIILVMRHASPLLAVSECDYLGEFKTVGDSVMWRRLTGEPSNNTRDRAYDIENDSQLE